MVKNSSNNFRWVWISLCGTALVLLCAIWGLGPKEQDPDSLQQISVSQHSENVPTLPSLPLERKGEGEPGALSRVLQNDWGEDVEANAFIILFLHDSTGLPVPNLRLGYRDAQSSIFLNLEEPPHDLYLGTTDSKGVLSVPMPFENSISIVSLDSQWLVVGKSIVGKTSPRAVPIQVLRGGIVHGVIADSSGPIEGAMVGAAVFSGFFGKDETNPAVRKLAFNPANYRYSRSDNLGRFQLYGLIPSTSSLVVLANGFAPMRVKFEGPGPGEDLDIGDLLLELGVNATISLISSEKLDKSTVLFLESSDSSYTRGSRGLPIDENQRVPISGIAPGTYKWIVERPRAVGAVGKLKISGTGGIVEIEIPPLRTLDVSVRANDGLPIAGVTVHAKEPGSQTKAFQGDESIQILGSENARIDIHVEAPGFAASDRIRVPPSESIVEVVLKRYGSLQLNLQGIAGKPSIHVGVLAEKDKRKLERLENGYSPVPLHTKEVNNQGLTLREVAPGASWVIIDVGAGPFAYGPFIVREGETAVAEIQVNISHEVIGLVRDEKTGEPIPEVGVRVFGTAKPGMARSIARALAPESTPDAMTDPEGRFKIYVPSDEPRYVSFDVSHYEPKSILVEPVLGQALSVELVSLPRTSLSVSMVESRPASHARVGFLRFASDVPLPEYLGQVRVDDNGLAELDSIPGGTCDVTVTFDYVAGVRYRVSIPQVEVAENSPIDLVLLKNVGKLVLPGFVGGARVEEINIRSVQLEEEGGLVVRCSGDWLTAGESPLLLSPGTYRIMVRSVNGDQFTTCNVVAGGITDVKIDEVAGQVFIELVGDDWTTCQLRFELIEGNLAGVIRDTKFMHQSEAFLVDELPLGLYQVTLVEWTNIHGEVVRPQWSQIMTIEEDAARVQFHLTATTPVIVNTVDSNGLSVGGVVVQAIVDGLGIVNGRSNQQGIAELVLPYGQVTILASSKGSAISVSSFECPPTEEITVVCSEGGQLKLFIEGNWNTGDVMVRLIPNTVFESRATSRLVQATLDGLMPNLIDPSRYEALIIDRIPEGAYTAIALSKGVEVGSVEIQIISGSETIDRLILQD